MGKQVYIICDACGADLNVPSLFPNYRLLLAAERILNPTGEYYCVTLRPPIDCDKHFCNVGCLTVWVEKNK